MSQPECDISAEDSVLRFLHASTLMPIISDPVRPTGHDKVSISMCTGLKQCVANVLFMRPILVVLRFYERLGLTLSHLLTALRFA